MDLEIRAELPDDGKVRIQKAARGATIYAGAVSVIFSLIHGINLAIAIGLGVVVAVDGFLIWLIYHKTSRRNDALMIVICPALLTLNIPHSPTFKQFLIVFAFHWLFIAPVMYVSSRFQRQRDQASLTLSDNSSTPSES